MSTQYPNIYYEQLAQMVISNPSIPLKMERFAFIKVRQNPTR